MLSLNYIKNAAQAGEYYDVVAENSQTMEESSQSHYYADKVGLWYGKGSRLLHLRSLPVNKESFINILDGLSPSGRKRLVEAGVNGIHRSALDYTFSVAKSVSLIAELIAPKLKDSIYTAHTEAVKKSLDYFERHYAEARLTVNHETETVKSGNLVVAMFQENYSRELDPQLHTHCVIANMTNRSDGKWRAITDEQLHYQKMFTGQIYRNYLAKNLQEMGLPIEPKPKGLFEIRGVPQDLIDSYSTRSDQIKAKLPELRERFPAARESVLKAMAAERTRKEKVNLDQAEIQEYWEGKWKENGYRKEELLKEVTNEKPVSSKEINHADLALKVLTEGESVVSKEKILQAGLQYSLGQKTIEDIEKDLATSQEAREVVAKELYTTRELHEIEAEIVQEAQATHSPQNALLARQGFMLLPTDQTLTNDQENALTNILASHQKVLSVQGDAGTGKSTLLSTLARNYQRAAYEVVPLSPTALAAQGLKGKKGLLRATTVDHFLTKSGSNRRQRLFVIDEASMLGSKKLHELLQQAHSSDTILLVGDDKQRTSIDAGAIFSKLQEHGLVKTLKLSENVRQDSRFLRRTVTHLANKETDKALEMLDKNDLIQEVEDQGERLQSVADKYVQQSRQSETMVITQTNAERQALNDLIRHKLKEKQHLALNGESLTTTHPKNVKLGERNLSFSYDTGDHFFLSQPIGDFGRGSRGQIVTVNHEENSLTAKVERNGMTKIVQVDLTKQGHHLSLYSQREQEFSRGDKVIFLKSDRKLGLENGRRATVLDVQTDGKLSVKTDNDKTVTFNVKDYAYIDHGYALSNQKVQGQEAPSVIFSADTRKMVNYNSLYVAASRAKESLHIYTNDQREFAKQAQVEQHKTSTLDYRGAHLRRHNQRSRDLSLEHELSLTR